MIKLVKPDKDLQSKFFDMVNDYIINNEDTLDRDYFEKNFDYINYIEKLRKLAVGLEIPEGYVPMTEWWLINDEIDIIGTVRLRHTLGEVNKYEGGHIGYDISPRYRRKGFGKKILKLVLEKAKELNMDKVLITCDADNIGSINIIESNNGVFESEILSSESGKKVLRYWIKI